MRSSFKSSAGFTLIELGMVLVILSLVIGPVFSYQTYKRDKDSYLITVQKQRKIATALSYFAQKHNYLPCPSRTVAGMGATDSRAIGLAAVSCNSTTYPAQRIGIVPFRTLGLTQDDIMDGYGNPFTYAVARSAHWMPGNPEFTGATPRIFAPCYGTASSVAPKYQKWGTSSRNKAFFCCNISNSVNHEMTIATPLNPLNPQMPPGIFYSFNTTSNADNIYDYMSEAFETVPAWNVSSSLLDREPTTEALLALRTQIAAYILISHGKNGYRSQLLGTTNLRQMAMSGTTNRGEVRNSDSHVWVDYPVSTKAGSGYFDDIVLWRTREQVMSETGTNSCMVP